MYFFKRHAPWIASLVLGLGLVGGGVYMIVQGVSVRNEIGTNLETSK